MPKRIAIVGGGPVGLEALLQATRRGHEAVLFEAGPVASSVGAWGHVRMFSPFGMNASAEALAHLSRHGRQAPAPDDLLTGAQYRENFLQPLAESLDGAVRTGTTVVAVAREGLGKGDAIMEPRRATVPFTLLVQKGDEERLHTADVVLDCSGNYANPNPLGPGGLPAMGERSLRDAIAYGAAPVGDPAGTRAMVVGAGHSAATLVCALAEGGAAHIAWVIRKPIKNAPFTPVPDDPLPERDRLVRRANRLAQTSGIVDVVAPATVRALRQNRSEIEVDFSLGDGRTRTFSVDRVHATTGFRPDLGLLRELQVQTCWATEGTYPLAALLLGEAGGDCLKTPAVGAATLAHPEPGFYTLGIKSFGRRSDFLLRAGFDQVRTVLDTLS